MTLPFQGAQRSIQVLNNPSETKIGDSCVTGVIHKDIWLETCQRGRKIGLMSIAYSFEITVNYVTGVEKVKSLSDIGQLVTKVSVCSDPIAEDLQDHVGLCQGICWYIPPGLRQASILR